MGEARRRAVNRQPELQLTPEMQRQMQQAMQQQQRQLMEVAAQLETPTVIVNSISIDPTQGLGIKIVFGESVQGSPLPPKARSAVFIQWAMAEHLVRGLIKAGVRVDREPVAAGSSEET
jgi:hypothetical protein